MSKSRDIATILGATETSNTSNAALITAAEAGGGGGGGGVTSYDSIGALPLSGNSAGDLAFVDSADRLYVNNGAGWYSISLVNATPTFTSVTDSNGRTTPFTLSTDGSSTVITAIATDSDGIPLTYNYSVTSGSLTNGGGTTATVSQSDNVFTITPTTTEDYAGDFTLTFTASDGINTGTSANVFSLQFSIINSQYTSLLMQADASSTDNQVDASSNSLTITETGTATSTAFSPYHPKKYSVYFDNSGDYLTTESTANVTIGSGDFTAEVWYYPTATLAAYKKIISTGTGSNNFAIETQSSGLTLSVTDYSSTVFGTADTALNQNEWNHIAVVRSSGTMKMYLNGTEVMSVSNSTNFTGTIVQAGWDGTVGYMRDVRLVVGTAVYTSAFTPPTEPLTAIANTKVLMCHLPYIADGSSNDLSITVNGNAKTELLSPYNQSASYSKSSHGGSVYFKEGDGSALEIPYNSGFAFDGDFTIETWIYHISHSGNYTGIIANANNNVSTSPTSGFSFSFYGVTNRLSFQTGDGLDLTTSNAIPTYIWTHLAVVRSGSTVTLYVNGEAQTSGSSSATIDAGSSYNLYLARGRATSSVPYVTCYLSNTRIVKGTAVYTSEFTPPTEPLTAISGTQLLTCTNKHEVWDAASGAKPNFNGDTTASTAQYKWSNSVYLDGTGDSLEFSKDVDLQIFNFGTVDWTIEFWARFPSLDGGKTILSLLRASANESAPYFYHSGSDLRYYVSAADRITGSSVLSTDTWYHIALSRDGNDHRLFLDGTQIGSTWTDNRTYTQGRLVIGDYYQSLGSLNGANRWGGYMEDLRITKGLARYTSNFTPPSAAFNG